MDPKSALGGPKLISRTGDAGDDDEQDDFNWACDRAGSTAPLMWRLSGKVNYRMTEMKMMEIIIYTYKQENRHLLIAKAATSEKMVGEKIMDGVSASAGRAPCNNPGPQTGLAHVWLLG